MNSVLIEKFEKFAKEKKLEGKAKDEAFEKFKVMITKYLYEPGEAIGVISAQSISEPATQMTMRSYTLASQSDRLSKVTQGLPRLIEIFDARKTFERNMIIYLRDDKNTKEDAKIVANKIKQQKIGDIVVSDSIDVAEMKMELEFSNTKDRDSIKVILEKAFKKNVIKTSKNKVIVEATEIDKKNLRTFRAKILAVHGKGFKGIENIIIVKEDDDWLIQTEGSNLKGVLEMPEVSIEKTRTNDLHQVMDVLGIEAARKVVYMETMDTLGQQGLNIDKRHIELLADIMTVDGEIKPIGRYGISGKKNSVLARANFEETKKHLVNASFYGQVDKMSGIIENVLAGQITPIGTGMVNLRIDMEKMRESLKKK